LHYKRASELVELNQSVPRLLSAYARALEYVGSQPMLQVYRTPRARAEPEPSMGLRPFQRLLRGWLFLPARRFSQPRPLSWLLFTPAHWFVKFVGNWWSGFAFGPLVRLFVETHIHSKTVHIGRHLRRARLALAEERSESLDFLDKQLRLLEYAERLATGWGRFISLLRFLPAVGVLFSLGIVAFSFDIREAPRQIFFILSLIPLVMLVIYPLIVRFGFRWKRAIFLSWPEEPNNAIDQEHLVRDESCPNIYELENRTYSDLGLEKGLEVPIDLLLHPAPYWFVDFLVASILIVVGLSTGEEDVTLGWALLGLTYLALLLACFRWTLGLFARYRRRKTSMML
jgi:hypothetical protein